MMGMELHYFGQNTALAQRLSTCARDLNLHFQQNTPPDNLSRGLFFFTDPTASLARALRDAPQAIRVLIAKPDPSDQKLYEPLWHDIISPEITEPLLSMRMDLYVRSLSGPDHLRSDNTRMRNELTTLNRQLTKSDHHLSTQNRMIEKLNNIRALSRQINCLDQKRIARVCMEAIPKLISARFASLYLFNPNGHTLELLRHNHPYAISRTVDLSENTDSPMALTARQKKITFLQDVGSYKDEQDRSVRRTFQKNYHSNSCMIAPLLSDDKVLGILNLADKMDGSCFSEAFDGPPIALLCEILGSALSNIHLYEQVHHQARTDGMTGQLNHKTFFEELEREISRADRYRHDLSLIMIDLDDFKTINDRYGHLAGDAVLIEISRHIRQSLRDTDIAARYGGDEFAAIMPNTALHEAMAAAERLIDRVTHDPFVFDGTNLPVSVSVGVCAYGQGTSLEQFVHDTDTALLEAKAQGKNRFHTAGMSV